MINKSNFIIVTLILLFTTTYINCIQIEGNTETEEIYFDDGTDEFMIIADTDKPIKLENIKAKKIFASAYHSAIIDENDHGYHWGLYSNIVTEVPNKIELPTSNNNQVNDISLGGNFMIIQSKETGELYSMGKLNYGVLGQGDTTKLNEDQVEKQLNKIVLPTTTTTTTSTVKSISSGYEHSIIVTEQDGVLGWGRNHKYQLGIDNIENTDKEQYYYDTPTTVINSQDSIYKDIKKVCSGSDHNLLLTNDGEVYSWGNAYFGAIGHGNKDNQILPKKIDFTPNTNSTEIIDIACGGYHSMFLTNQNEIYTFGYGEFGQLGHGENNTVNQLRPKRIKETGVNYGGNKIKSIYAGDHGNSFYITVDGDLYSWGWSESGSLGHGDTSNQFKPKKVNSLSNIVSVAAGFKHTIALDENGDVYVFGDNTYGQSGLKHNNHPTATTDDDIVENTITKDQFEQQDVDNFNNILNLI